MLDFSKRNVKKLDVTLPNNRKIHLLSPKGALLKKFNNFSLNDNIEKQDISMVYSVATEVLNNNDNPALFKFQPQQIEEMFDIKDIMDLLTGYMTFVEGVLNDPN